MNSSESALSTSPEPVRIHINRRVRAKTYVFLLTTRILRLVPPRHLPAFLEPRRAPGRVDLESAEAAVAAVDIWLARRTRLLPTGCFPRGMALYYFLRRAGVEVTLVFGASVQGGEPTAHCWIVRDGRPYAEKVDPTSKFVPIWRIGPRGSAAAVAVNES